MPAPRPVEVRYSDAVAADLKRAARLDRRELRGILEMLNKARREVVDTVATTDWKGAQREVAKRRIEAAMADLAKALGLDIRKYQDRKWRTGATDTDALLERFGGLAERIGQPLSTERLRALKALGLEQVVDVTERSRQKAATIMRLGALADKSPHEVIQELGRSIVGKNGAPSAGIWGDVITRAEVIYRTEGNRVYSTATQARMEQHERVRPGLLKTWMHSLNDPGRPSHIRAADDYAPGGDPGPIPVAEPFILRVQSDEAKSGLPAGEYRAMYPRDPSLPAGLSVSCGCVSSPYRNEWGDGEA